ncbi:MAG: nickel-responsive transcriptional regulator NikR [Bacteroidota bacterium]|nr:nickel-responsive transcriptional regulator NikR [Bacteroidota bacterium]
MKKINRFGISMEDSLLRQFDKLISQKGYTNRSEAVRDLVREKIIEENIEATNEEVYGALVFIYDHHKRELEKNLSNLQHDYFKNIVSTTHVHIDHDTCLEMIIVRGQTKLLKNIAERLLSFKGVLNGKLTLTSSIKNKLSNNTRNLK